MNSSEACLLLDEKFQSRLDEQYSEIYYKLSTKAAHQTITWVDLKRESNESLGKRSRSQKNVRLRARDFSQRVLTIGSDLFVLCSLSFSISGLPRIAHVSFYDRLENWWKAKTTPAALLSLTVRICRLLHSDQQSYQALRAEFLSQESARIVPAPTLREDLHALFPAISSDEAPGAEPEEVFRASHKNCMEAFDESSMPPLKRRKSELFLARDCFLYIEI